jgi:dihydroneopterin aldolase
MRVFIEGLEFYAYHGVPDAEQAIGHRYELDIELQVSQNASETDNIADTVDYGVVAQFAMEVGQSNQFRTLERLADELCKRLLDQHERILSVSVTVKKPLPPAPVIVKAVGVQSTRTK